MSAANDRQFESIDQMLTMHSSLRDMYAQRTLLLSCILFVASILLNAFVFVGEETLWLFRSDPKLLKFWIGAASVTVFVVSILELRFDWAGTSRVHKEAADRLAALKLAFCRNYESADCENPQKLAELGSEYGRVVALAPSIPERHFHRLKHRHWKKRRLSQYISKYPGVPLFLLRCKILFDGVRILTRRSVEK